MMSLMEIQTFDGRDDPHPQSFQSRDSESERNLYDRISKLSILTFKILKS
jgi:hypothetical protein